LRLLLDTHLLLWSAANAPQLSASARSLITDPQNELFFSAASIWEVAIKTSLGRPNFRVDPTQLRRSLLDGNYRELSITSQHAVVVATLPLLHRDPFDRILLAQAIVEDMTLLTADPRIAQYPGPVRQLS
jgi:PIN domain nuclease of toxin-antitoxin system